MFDESGEQFRKSYAAGREAYQRAHDDRKVFITLVVITLLGALLLEFLAHYTTWSFVPRIAVSVAAVVLAQYLAARHFNQPPPKIG
jgi:hypothetical protein